MYACVYVRTYLRWVLDNFPYQSRHVLFDVFVSVCYESCDGGGRRNTAHMTAIITVLHTLYHCLSQAMHTSVWMFSEYACAPACSAHRYVGTCSMNIHMYLTCCVRMHVLCKYCSVSMCKYLWDWWARWGIPLPPPPSLPAPRCVWPPGWGRRRADVSAWRRCCLPAGQGELLRLHPPLSVQAGRMERDSRNARHVALRMYTTSVKRYVIYEWINIVCVQYAGITYHCIRMLQFMHHIHTYVCGVKI